MDEQTHDVSQTNEDASESIESAKPTQAAAQTETTSTADPEGDTGLPTPTPLVRKFQENTTYFSDLFKLDLSKCLKWMGYKKDDLTAPFHEDGTVNSPAWQLVEHVHFFRTVDSKGKPQTHSAPVANHYHKMEVVRDPNDKEKILSVECVSGPMKWGVVKRYGKKKRELIPVNEHDKHTHDIVYLKSKELTKPKMNPEALKVIGAQASRNTTQVYDDQGRPLGNLAVT